MTDRSRRVRQLGPVAVVVLVLLSVTTVVTPVQASGGGIQSGTVDTFSSNTWAFNDMAQNSSGIIHQVNIDENDRITVRAWDGSAWSVVTSFTAAEVTDVTVERLSNDLSLDIDSQDHLHLTYRGSYGDNLAGPRGVLYAEYDGSSWTHSWVENASDSGGGKNFDDPVLVVDGSDTPHLQYEYSTSGTNDIRYATPDGAGGWTVETVVSTDGSGTDEVKVGVIDVESTETVHLWYVREDNQNTYYGNVYHAERPSGGSWSSPTKVIDSTGDGTHYYLGDALIDDNDNRHLVYSYTEYDTDGFITNSEIRHLSDETGTMQDTLVAQNSSQSLFALGLQHTTQGPHDLYVMVDSSDDSWSVVYEEFWGRDSEGQWVDGTDLSFTSVSTSEMVFEVSSSGELVMVVEGTNLRNVYYKAGPVTAFVPTPNTPPTFDTASPSVSVDEDDGATSIDSLLAATDTEGGSTLTWSVASAPSNGTLGGFDATANVGTGVIPNGLTYTPDADFFGSDSFDVQVDDGLGGTDTVTVDVTVSGTPDVPVASDESLTADEDTNGSLTLPATDVDGDSLTYSVVTQPTDGTVTVDGTTLTYDPDDDFAGSNVFSYQVDDGTDGTDTGTVSVTVSATNDAPVATADSLSTDEEVSADVDVSATDIDGDDLTYGVASQADNGWVYNVNETFTYVPDTDFFGSDAFTYEADDGNGGTDTATVSVTVTNVNDAPVAPDDSLTTDEDTAGIVVGAATDVDGDDLTYTVLAEPSNGSVSVASGKFTYTPDADFAGSDSFTYEVDDGNTGTDSGTVSVTVTEVNDAPVADGDSYTTDEDTELVIDASAGVLANDTDVEGDTLTATVTSGPANGSLSLASDGSFDYTPDPDFFGSDAFTYEVDDGNTGTDTATVSVTVTGVNDAPVTDGDSHTTDEDTTLSVSAPGVLGNDADVDGDTLTATVTSGPANGSLSLASDGSFDYTPDPDFFGSDAFTYEVDDGNTGTDTGTVSVSVTAVNDAPTVDDDEYATDEDTTLSVDASAGVLANDTDVEGDSLSVTVASGPSNGSLKFASDGSFHYTPDANFTGSDSFAYEADDGNGGTTQGTVTVAVAVVADPPSLSNLDGATVTYTEDGAPVSLDAAPHVTVTDPDATRATGTLVASVTANGTTSEDALGLNTSGPVSLSAGLTAGSTVSVSGAAVGTVRSGEGGTNGEALGIAFEPGVTDAQVESLLRALTYENTNAGAPDTRPRTVTVTLSDAGGSDAAAVTVSVAAVNDAPTVVTDQYTMKEDTALTVPAPGVLANDVDADGDGLVVNATLGASPSNGTLTRFTNGSFGYTPDEDFAGSDSFTYEVDDGNGGTGTGTVTVVVTDVTEPRSSGGEEAPTGRVLLSTSSPIDSVSGRATFGAASDSVESVQVQFSGRARGRWRASQLESPPAESNYAGDEEDVVASLDISVPPSVKNRPAVVTMTVRQSRVDAMGVTSDQLVVDHYDEPTDTWTRLESRVVSTANGYVTLEVQTPHFSLFVISADRTVVSPPALNPARPTTPDTTDDIGDSADEEAVLDDLVEELPDDVPVPGVDADGVAPEELPGSDGRVSAATLALLLVLAAAAVGVGLRRRR